MPRLDREQAISVAVLVLLLLVSASVVGVLFQTRADAVQESSERREILSRLAAWLRGARVSRDVRNFPAPRRRASETTPPPRTRTPEAAEQEPRRKLPAHGRVAAYLNPPQS